MFENINSTLIYVILGAVFAIISLIVYFKLIKQKEHLDQETTPSATTSSIALETTPTFTLPEMIATTSTIGQ